MIFYYSFSKRIIQNSILLIFSYFFYGYWDVRFLYLIVLSSYVDFYCGLIIANKKITLKNRIGTSLFFLICSFLFIEISWDNQIRFSKMGYGIFSALFFIFFLNFIYSQVINNKIKNFERIGVITSIWVNLGILGFFKYFNFFTESLIVVFKKIGFTSNFEMLNIVLPVGISFYTFQTMSYSLDIKNKDLEPTSNFIDFSVFVSFFPQLVAGPIERAKVFLPQVYGNRVFDLNNFKRGLFLIVLGFFKKVAIADPISRFVTPGFSLTENFHFLDVYLSTFFFTIQIYGDFSGYSDIARGLSKLFGFNLMVNFQRPYFSRTPSDFWRRWHISLSSWLRDYLYIPLGGNKFSYFLTYRHLFLTMLIGGLWHGASWNFVLWGAYQGVILIFFRLFSLNPRKGNILSNLIYHFIFFHITMYGWLLFRADSFKLILKNSSALFSMSSKLIIPTNIGLPLIASICILVFYEFIVEFKLFIKFNKNPYVQDLLIGGGVGIMLFCILVGNLKPPAPFIYFQF